MDKFIPYETYLPEKILIPLFKGLDIENILS